MRRVAVTGLGAVTPLGNDRRSTWESAVAGRSGIDFISTFDTSGFPVRIAAEVRGFDPASVVGPKEARRLDRNVVMAVAAATEAAADASLADAYDAASGQIAIALGLRGPNYAPVSACATGSTAIGEAAEVIRRGSADAVLAGGAEACLHPLILAGFCAMRGLAAEEEHPPRASRPFDLTRAGFVMGEGACVLVLEELEAARKRGATIYAEILSYGASNDAHHMAQPDPD